VAFALQLCGCRRRLFVLFTRQASQLWELLNTDRATINDPLTGQMDRNPPWKLFYRTHCNKQFLHILKYSLGGVALTWSVRLSVCLFFVCHICALHLNRSTDWDAIWHIHMRGPMAHFIRRTSLIHQDILGFNAQLKHAIANGSHLANAKEDNAITPFSKLLWFLFDIIDKTFDRSNVNASFLFDDRKQVKETRSGNEHR